MNSPWRSSLELKLGALERGRSLRGRVGLPALDKSEGVPCPLYSARVIGLGPEAILLRLDRDVGCAGNPDKAPPRDGRRSIPEKPAAPVAKDCRRDEGCEEVIAKSEGKAGAYDGSRCGMGR